MTDTSEKTGAERRKYRRANVHVELRLLAPEQHVMLLSHTIDLSRRGAFIRSNKPLPIGSRVLLSIDRGAQRDPLQLEATVVRVGKLQEGRFPGIALNFTDITEREEAKIDELIERT